MFYKMIEFQCLNKAVIVKFTHRRVFKPSLAPEYDMATQQYSYSYIKYLPQTAAISGTRRLFYCSFHVTKTSVTYATALIP